jgi:hypothetical protein
VYFDRQDRPREEALSLPSEHFAPVDTHHQHARCVFTVPPVPAGGSSSTRVERTARSTLTNAWPDKSDACDVQHVVSLEIAGAE